MGTIAAIRSAVLVGDGVAVLPEYLLKRDLKAARLKVVLPQVTPHHDYFHLFYRADDARLGTYESVAALLQRWPPR